MNNQYSQIKIDKDGLLLIDGVFLQEGDLLEVDLFKRSESMIGQVEVINGEYQISLFEYEYGRLKISAGGPAPIARILAQRPKALPSLNKPYLASTNPSVFFTWLPEESLIYQFYGINPDNHVVDDDGKETENSHPTKVHMWKGNRSVSKCEPSFL